MWAKNQFRWRGKSLFVLLDELIRYGATHDVQGVVIGMAHRGLLNVLANSTGKPRALFDEFDGRNIHPLPVGDVKDHTGFTGTTETAHQQSRIEMAFNPPDLRIINPVVQGIARAKEETLRESRGIVLSVRFTAIRQ